MKMAQTLLIISTILKIPGTGKIGDGKIFISSLEEAI
jgi:nitrogen regulatory protein PII